MEIALSLISTGVSAITGGGAAAGAATAGATAATGAAAAGGAAAAAGSGFSLAHLLEGTATLLGAVSAIGAGNADAEVLTAQARDAEEEQSLETLKGITRRTGIKKELIDSIGSIDTAFAASGVDLSFGTPAVARQEAYREADTALTSDAGTQTTRQSRLAERSANLYAAARRARSRGFQNALFAGLSYGANLAARG